ncbi:uncharacterized protein LOC119167997 [Rhipicephalus microplus]|uniref:uncharacterized protein LOC119167997 n=1 Tax=Rhipicephalus microplus TaxID=6941 RepID=UPI0023764AA9
MKQLRDLTGVFFLLMTMMLVRGEKQSEEDIVQFWNTSELIWTAFTTSSEAILCKADLKVDISENNITFYRAYVRRSWFYKREYNGTFRHFYQNLSTPYDSVRIQSRNGRNKAREVLQYQSKNNTCAVVWTITSKGYQLIAAYDLRIKNSHIKKGHFNSSECWEQFQNVTRRRRIQRTYYPNCHDVPEIRLMSSVFKMRRQ